MKRIILGGVAISALLIAAPLSAAGAADMALKAPLAPAPAWSWTGFYIGAHGGGDWFNNSWFVPNTPINIAGVCAVAGCNYSTGSNSSSSWLFGGLVGYNYQIDRWVLGVEAQANWTHLQASNAQPLTPTTFDNSKTDSLGTIAARLGMTWDRTLLYAKGGAAWAHDTFWTTNPGCLPTTICQSVTTTQWGWVVGAGVEQALTPNWSVKLEYNHLDFGNRTETLANVAAGGPFEYNVRQTVDLVEAGVNYRFNWGGGPIVAKY